MPTKTFRYAAFALKILNKLLGSRFSVHGLEKLPNKPVMFVANHFTRCETFFIPYLIYKHSGRQIRCLADSGLYSGLLGKFLRSAGTISTKEKGRDNIILKDLITGKYDWMIYPEGSMLKSKEIRRKEAFINHTPHRVGPVRTGSAVLALKSELFRMDIVEAFEKKDQATLNRFKEDFGIQYQNDLKEINTHIVPLNITYYPIRPGKNIIQKLAGRLVKKIPKQIAEELEIEGNLLLGGEMNIGFGDPINLGQYINKTRNILQQVPIIKRDVKNNLALRYLKVRLTNKFMERIYSDIQINLDHIFSAALYHFKEEVIEVNRLKRVIYLSAIMLKNSKKYRLSSSIYEENLFKIFIDEPYYEFDSVFDLAKRQGMIKESSPGEIYLNKLVFEEKYNFHEIRLENTLQVVANEFLLLDTANSIVKRNTKVCDDELRNRVFEQLYNSDIKNFNRDYDKYFDQKFSKDKSVGRPFFLDSRAKVSAKVRGVGILISHGYKSAPKEVEALAKFLNGFGFKVYAARLSGHGTAPANLAKVSWQDWYNSLQHGYAALQNISTKIIIIGFSTGGLLSLLSAANKHNKSKKLSGVISINAALKLLDIRTKMVPGINLWNEILAKFSIERGRLEYIDDSPENPYINYSRNYVKGVYELGKLMEVCKDSLKKVLTNALIIQANKDPIVNPASGKIIYDEINSVKKFLTEVDFSNHVIINSDRKEEIFEIVRNFLVKIKII